VVVLAQEDDAGIERASGFLEELEQALQELIEVPDGEGGGGDALQVANGVIVSNHIAIDGLTDRPVDGEVKEPELLRMPVRGRRTMDVRHDAVAKDAELSHHLTDIESMGESIEGVAARGHRAGGRSDALRQLVGRMANAVENLRDVIDQRGAVEATSDRNPSDLALPVANDVLAVLAYEIR
jgi:hypothetical protein